MRIDYSRPVWVCLVLCAIASASARAQDLPVVHALLVADTLAKDIDGKSMGPGLLEDSKTMERALRTGLGDHRVNITVLKGDDVNRTAILEYYQNVQSGPSDVLFFHYAGHGGLYTKPKKEHQLQLSKGGWLPRSELRKAMQAKNPALLVILTDCCSTEIPRERRPGAILPKRPIVPRPPLNFSEPGYKQLFFRTHGIVDITAADDGEAALGDNVHGGVFTRAFHDVLTRNASNKGLNWSEFYPMLKDGIVEAHKKVRYADPPQTSRAFGLPGAAWGFTASMEKYGVRVSEVHFNSPAERAGLQRDDTIVGVRGQAVRSIEELGAEIGKLPQGASLPLTVRRDGNTTQVVITR